MATTPVSTSSTTVNPQGLTAQQMGQLAQQQAQDRISAQATASPGTLVQGPQVGSYANPSGQSTPVTIQAYRAPATQGAQAAPTAPQAAPTAPAAAPKPAYAPMSGTEWVWNEGLKTWDMVQTKGLDKDTLSQVQGYSPAGSASGAAAGATSPYEDKYMKLLDTQQQLLTQQYEANQQRTQQEYEAKSRAMAETQRQEAGLASVQLARIGALGTSGSGIAYLQSMQTQHQQELLTLDQQRQQVLTDAQNAYNSDNLKLAQTRLETLKDLDKEAEDRQQRMLDNQVKYQQIQKYERDNANDTINSIVKSGMDPENLPDGYLDSLDRAAGMPEGLSRSLFDVARSEQEAAALKDEEARKSKDVENASKIVTILDKIPKGKTINIAGVEYEGLSSGDIKTGTEVDDSGNVTFWQFDSQTGAVKTTSLGGIGKAQDGWETKFADDGSAWRFNSKTGQMVPYTPSDAQQVYSDAYPNGTVGQTLPGHEANAGQCGAFCNSLYGVGIWGDSIASKKATLAKYAVPKEDVQVGDTLVQTAGTTGHVAIVNAVNVTPEGKVMVTLTESNMVPPYGKVMSNTRTMSIDDAKIVGFARIPLSNAPMTGTDASVTPKATPVVSSTLPSVPQESTAPTFGKDAAKPLTATELKAYKDMGYEVKPGMTQADLTKLQPTSPENKQATELQQNALNTAKQMVADFDKGKWIVGGSSLIADWATLPGSAAADYRIKYNNLKSLLALDNVKYLKGQGQVSDAERKLLAEASSQLDVHSSEAEFKKALNDIVTVLSKAKGTTGTGTTEKPTEAPPPGEIWVKDKNGQIGSIPESEFDASSYTKL